MHRRMKLLVCAGLLSAVCASPVRSAQPADAQPDDDPVRARLSDLGSQFDVLSDINQKLLPADGAELSDSSLTDEEWLAQGRAAEARVPDPELIVLPQLMGLAKQHPDSPYALDALAFVVFHGGPLTGDVRGVPWRLKEQALTLLQEQHLDDPRIARVFDDLGGSLPSAKTEAFLRHALASGPTKSTRAAAALGLARYFDRLGEAHRVCRHLKTKSPLRNTDRHWKIAVAPYLEQQFPHDRGKVTGEIDRLLALIVAEYADVPAIKWRGSGPAGMFMKTDPRDQPKTYGQLAQSMMRELSSIVPGKKAPDIEGTDAQGQRFRLSDYQGKVVLLTFSADWCGGCVKLYPLQRRLIEKYREQPFVLLSVSRDETVDTLRASIASGDITWRCWWDGIDGPIRSAWNSRGVPGIILLDRDHVIQDVLLGSQTSQREFENAIEPLLGS